MVEAAAESGDLTDDGMVVEATSGNTGIGLAAVCAARGYDCVLTMPESMSEERRRCSRGWRGPRTHPADGGMSGAIERANELADAPGTVRARQFENEANPRAHRETTGPEIGPIPTATWTRSSPVSGPAARHRHLGVHQGKGRRGPHISRC